MQQKSLYVFRDFDFEGILNGFWEGFGMLIPRFGGPKPSKMRSGTHKNQYEIEVKKNIEKKRGSKGRPSLSQEADPSGTNLHDRVLEAFSWKISTPCRREANFRLLA